MTWTQKEKNFLKDLQSEEKLCAEKYHKAAEAACDGTLKQILQKIEKAEQGHCDTVTGMLAGTMPAPQSQGKAQAGRARSAKSLKAKTTRAQKQSDAYLLQAIRYVHDNPENAGICSAAEYPWSSYHEYVGPGEISDTSLALDMLGGIEGFVAFSHPEQRRTYRFDRRARVPDEEVSKVARLALGDLPAHEVKALPKTERDQRLLDLREVGLSVKQIERLTGIGTCTISRVTNKLRRTRAGRAE